MHNSYSIERWTGSSWGECGRGIMNENVASKEAIDLAKRNPQFKYRVVEVDAKTKRRSVVGVF